MKFYNSIGPNPRVVRMFMAEKGIEIPSEDVNLMKGDNRREPHLSRNTMGQMPALEIEGGHHVTEITVICEYLDEIAIGGTRARCHPGASVLVGHHGGHRARYFPN